jgi:DnaJ-class molecular chaperone
MTCKVCEGAGEVEVRPFPTASPYDKRKPCRKCLGTGRRLNLTGTRKP